MKRINVMNRKIWVPQPPKDVNGLTLGGNYQFACLKNGARWAAHFIFGNVAADGTITLKQAKNVGGSGAKALAFTTYYYCKTNDGDVEQQDTFQKLTATGNSITVANATDDNGYFMIEGKTDMLDVSNGFDCIRPELTGGAGATLAMIMLELNDLRYGGTLGNDKVPSMLGHG